MRVVIVGASGNVGTSLIRTLEHEPRVESILGVARRRPGWNPPKVEWATADVRSDDLVPLFRGADCVVALAWLIQPSRDESVTRAVNVDGSRRIFEATVAAGVPALVYSSSIGAYSPAPKDRPVDESWPTGGIRSSFYSRHKADVERILDEVERSSPGLRSVRIRPGLVFKREAATGIRRLFAGPLLPTPLMRRTRIPVFPNIPNLVVQGVHSLDLADAFRLAIVADARGAYNVAADPVLDVAAFSAALHARPVPVPAAVARALTDVTWRLRLQPTPPGWVDLALNVPVMDTSRARDELGWRPRRTATEAFLEVLEGMHDGAGLDTPPLSPDTSGPARSREIGTGVGGSST